MTKEQLIDSMVISTGLLKNEVTQRVNVLLPATISHILSKSQWDFMTKYVEFSTSTTDEFMELPEDFWKEIKLWHSNITIPCGYISPEEYAEKKAQSSTFYGAEATKFTIVADENNPKIKKIAFLDQPTSAITIKMYYTRDPAGLGIENIPDNFLGTIISHLLYKMTPPTVEIAGIKQSNPAFSTARNDYRTNLIELISSEQGRRGITERPSLSNVHKNWHSYLHP
ncbi:MAG: hypothetical protein ACOZAL_02880 [Patescibacteria group bacterium]